MLLFCLRYYKCVCVCVFALWKSHFETDCGKINSTGGRNERKLAKRNCKEMRVEYNLKKDKYTPVLKMGKLTGQSLKTAEGNNQWEW